jgi:phosphate transport system substrate-binding protein
MQYKLTIEHIFKALARRIPVNGSLIENEYTHWSDIDASLPKVKISVYGPPPTSGTRDAFVELIMEKACVDLPEFKAAYPEKKERKKQCHLLREDGAFIESGENDNLIIQKLRTNRDALGIFGYSFLEQNSEIVQGASIGGATPEFESISRGEYPVSRPLFVYMKDAHVAKIPGLGEFVEELVSDNAIGVEGYLTFKGLVPLGMEVRNEMRNRVEDKL